MTTSRANLRELCHGRQSGGQLSDYANAGGPERQAGQLHRTSTNGTLKVIAAALTVTAIKRPLLWRHNPLFTGTITGLQNGDNITANYATSATVTARWGAYPIAPGAGGPQRQARQLHRLQHQRHAEGDGAGADGGGQQRFPRLRHDQPGVQRHDHRHPERGQHHCHLRQALPR